MTFLTNKTAEARADESPDLSSRSPAAPDEEAEAESRQQAIVVVSSLGHALCHVGELVFTGAVSAVMTEFGLEPFHAVMLAWLGYILMGVGALPFGYWADTWGSTRLLRIYFVALAVAGLAVALTQDVWSLFAGLTVLGIAVSIYHPVGLAMISLGVKDRGRAMGINGAAGSLGVATGPALGMLAASLGVWRLGFVVLAVLSLAALALMAVWMPAVPKARVPAPLPARPDSSASPSASQRGATGLQYLALALLMAAMMLGGFNYRCLVTALPPFLTGDAPDPASLVRGGLFVWLAFVVGGLGQYLGGWLAERKGAFRLYFLLIGLLAVFALLLRMAEASPLVTPVACGLAVCLFSLQPIENIILADWTSEGRRSLSYATKFAFTFGLGALGAPVVGKIWSEFHALGLVFYLLAGSATLMGLISLSAVLVWRKAQAMQT